MIDYKSDEDPHLTYSIGESLPTEAASAIYVELSDTNTSNFTHRDTPDNIILGRD